MKKNFKLTRIGGREHRTLTDATVETIRAAIKSGDFLPGSQLPPEIEVCSQLGVSRTTLREAFRILENDHLIERRRGLGTFVLSSPILKEFGSNFGITEMILESGHVPSSSHDEVRWEKATSEVASALKLTEGGPVISIERVRTASGKPVVVSLDILPADLIKEEDLGGLPNWKESLYQYLAEELNIFITHGVARIWPTIANKEMCTKLSVHMGTPLLVLSQIDFDASNNPILYSIEHHLGDMFRFVVSRRGPY